MGKLIAESSSKEMKEIADNPEILINNLKNIRVKNISVSPHYKSEEIPYIKPNGIQDLKKEDKNLIENKLEVTPDKEKSISIASEVMEKFFSRTGNVLTSLSDINRIINSKLIENPNSDLKIAKDLIEKSNLQASLLNEEVLDLRVFPMSDVMRRVKRSGFEAARSSGKKVDILVNGETS